MADGNTIVEGSVLFREGKKWKARWCVLRKLSPVADTVQLAVHRAARAAREGGAAKAVLALDTYVGCESGFQLDGRAHTLALLCRDTTCVLALESRGALQRWRGALQGALGGRAHVVLCARRGPARLHVRARRAALAAGTPPRLLAHWELRHLRRYGVLDGRFCLEAGSACGKFQGLHVFLSERADDIADDFERASREELSPRRLSLAANKHDGAEAAERRVEARLGERVAGEPVAGEPAAGGPARWPSTDLGLGDTASVNESVMEGGAWGGARGVALERCRSCMSKLGALSRSSTAPLTPGATHFSPTWTMEAVQEKAPRSDPPAPHPDSPAPCPGPAAQPPPPLAPARPPKPTCLDLRLDSKPPAPLPSCTPALSCGCARVPSVEESVSSWIGPYENYDVPKLPSAEIGAEYYDTPKRLKECLNSELFKIAKSPSTSGMILKKPCGCVLRVCERAPPAPPAAPAPAACVCRRVTDWAHSWIRLPYCRKAALSSDRLHTDEAPPDTRDALYATVDLSRKTRRKTHPVDPAEDVQEERGPLAHYENLNFALSLEYYENAKQLLRRAGVTPLELAALGASLRATGAGDYLLMEPPALDADREHRSLPPGYTPMSPIGGFALGPRDLAPPPFTRLLDDKSASNPALSVEDAGGGDADTRAGDRVEYRKRSSSADSSRFLEDVKEFDGSGGSSSSLETLREPTTCGQRGGGGPATRGGEGGARRAASAPQGKAGANRDSSSSNDSGVSSCSLRGAAAEFELPVTTAAGARRHYRRAAARTPPHAPPRRSRSQHAPRAPPHHGPCAPPYHAHKSSSAEAEVPILKPITGALATPSTSSGTSDMSDYIETLSICSSHSSTDTPITMRMARQTTSTLRPRSGKEYGSVAPLYSNLP